MIVLCNNANNNNNSNGNINVLSLVLLFLFTVPMAEVQVVKKETANLPCDISLPDTKSDDVILVLWYREDLGRPIYRLVQYTTYNIKQLSLS